MVHKTRKVNPLAEERLTQPPRKAQSWRRWAKALASTAIVLLILFFIGRVMIRNWGQIQYAIQEGTLKIRWLPLGVSFLLLGVHLVSRSLLWHLITLRNGVGIPMKEAMICWFISLLGKNIPGKVFLLAGRVYLYGQFGKDQAIVAFCFLLEATCALIASACIFILSLLFLDLPMGELPRTPAFLLTGVALAAFLFLLNPRVLGWLLGKAFRLIGKKEVRIRVPRFSDLLTFVLIAMWNWLLLGVGFFFMTNAIYSVSIGFLPYFAGSFSLAAIIGVLSLFAPAGIGVREGVLFSLIKFVIPVGIASVVVLIARLWMTAGELLVSLLALSFRGFRHRYNIAKCVAKDTL